MRIIGLILCSALFVGCGAQEPPSDSPSESASPRTHDEVSGAEYADFIRSNIPELSSVSDETIIENAVVTCAAFEVDLTFEDVISNSMAAGLSADTAGSLIGGAIAWKCPEYEYVLD